MKDYYQILGINKNATQDEIKKAYRKLSKQFHPDVNPQGEDKFKQIAEAYDVLSDENKKNQYDNPNPFGNGFEGGNPFDMFNDIINNQRQRRPPKVKDKTIKVTLTPEESYKGSEKEITYQYKDSCQLCSGSGGDKNMCNVCNGSGFVQQRVGTGLFTQIVETNCPSCRGRGQIVINPCHNCNGEGSIDRFQTIKINIPKSVDNGDFLRVNGKGDYINGTQGDLLLQIDISRTQYEKIGKDLVYNLKMSPVDMITKSQQIIPHPNGDLQINIPSGATTERPLRIKSKGYITPNGVGDFYIKINVVKGELSAQESERLKNFLEQTT